MLKRTWRKRLIGLLITVAFFCQMAASTFAGSFDGAQDLASPSTTSGTSGLATGQGVSGAGEMSFSDMASEDSWSYAALTTAIECGLLRGDNGKIRPRDGLTRAEMITIVLRVLGLDDSQGRDLAPFKADVSRFRDVRTSDWYFDEISMAYKLKLLNGTSDGEMSPNGTVSREQALIILCRALGLDTAYADESALSKFSDAGDLSSWARPFVSVMAAKGYVKGSDGALNPLAAVTRQEFAQMLYNIFGRSYLSGQEDADALSGKEIAGSIVVSAQGITLSGLVVDGDVILGDGVGDGNVVLDGVTIGGSLVDPGRWPGHYLPQEHRNRHRRH